MVVVKGENLTGSWGFFRISGAGRVIALNQKSKTLTDVEARLRRRARQPLRLGRGQLVATMVLQESAPFFA